MQVFETLWLHKLFLVSRHSPYKLGTYALVCFQVLIFLRTIYNDMKAEMPVNKSLTSSNKFS